VREPNGSDVDDPEGRATDIAQLELIAEADEPI
jgi:hypothetical protein